MERNLEVEFLFLNALDEDSNCRVSILGQIFMRCKSVDLNHGVGKLRIYIYFCIKAYFTISYYIFLVLFVKKLTSRTF